MESGAETEQRANAVSPAYREYPGDRGRRDAMCVQPRVRADTPGRVHYGLGSLPMPVRTPTFGAMVRKASSFWRTPTV